MPNGVGTFRVMLRMEIKPGMGPEFEQTWRAVGDAVTSHEANLGQWLMRDTDDANVYYIISDWTDEPQFRAFEHSEEHVEHRKKLHPYRSGGTMATMSVVQALAPNAVRS
jgi:heme-degrading monooxygenase HmoA